MNITKENVIKIITDQLNECLEYHNAEDFDLKNKVQDVDLENQTITIKFNFHVVEEDDYIGLGEY